jgi:hypothetical protein
MKSTYLCMQLVPQHIVLRNTSPGGSNPNNSETILVFSEGKNQGYSWYGIPLARMFARFGARTRIRGECHAAWGGRVISRHTHKTSCRCLVRAPKQDET